MSIYYVISDSIGCLEMTVKRFGLLKKNFGLYILALPGLVFLIVFSFFPMYSHLLAFKDFVPRLGIWGSDWVLFENFKFFFSGGIWKQITFNTLYLNLLFITFTIITALAIAIFVDDIGGKLLRRFLQSSVFLPYFVSWLVVQMLVLAMLSQTNGIINMLIKQAGGATVPFFSLPEIWPAILTFLYVWKHAGYYSIIFLSVIISIPPEHFEAAKIDGATRVQQIRYITLPMLKGTVIILVFLSIGRIFYGDFGMIYGIIGDNGALYDTTEVIDTYAYRALRFYGSFSMAAAVTLFQSVMGMITVVIFNMLVKKIDNNYRIF